MAACLGRRWNLPSLLIWGNDAELARAEQIVAASAGHAILAPRVPLLQVAALARRARFAIGSDTGPLHLAAAAGARASDFTDPGRPTSTAPTVRDTSTCRRCA